jgi:hypothetical protein
MTRRWDSVDVNKQDRGGGRQSEGIFCSPARRIAVGDVQLVGRLLFLQRGRWSTPEVGATWRSAVMRDAHNADLQRKKYVVRRGSELPEYGARE